MTTPEKILAIDVGGTHVKLLATGQQEAVKIPSGPSMSAEEMVRDALGATHEWDYQVVSIGYPGPVVAQRAGEESAVAAGRLGRLDAFDQDPTYL